MTPTSRSSMETRSALAALLLLLAASPVPARLPALDELGWRLYTHRVPFRKLNISKDAELRYWKMMRSSPPPAMDEGGLYHAVVHDLPRVLPAWTPSAQDWSDERVWREPHVLFLLPISPYHLCKAAEYANTSWGRVNPFTEPKGSIPTNIRVSMKFALENGLSNYTITCPTYERVLAWVFSTPQWRAAPQRHVWTMVLAHLLRGALFHDVRAYGEARSLYARMARGLVVTAEDRWYDCIDAARCGHIVPAPYYSPPFFLHGAPLEQLAQYKPELVTVSGPQNTACHRFDNPPTPGRWRCLDDELRLGRIVRQISFKLITRRNEQLRAGGQKVLAAAAQLTERGHRQYENLLALLRSKAALYQRSVFCIIPTGDSVITTRIFSTVAALCIPVFVLPLEYLPFQHLVHWDRLSLKLNYSEFWDHDRHPTRFPNPLAKLEALVAQRPDEVRRMQAELERARWLLTYHRPGEVPGIPGADAKPSAGEALAYHLVRAAEGRQKLERADGSDDGGMGVLECSRTRWNARSNRKLHVKPPTPLVRPGTAQARAGRR